LNHEIGPPGKRLPRGARPVSVDLVGFWRALVFADLLLLALLFLLKIRDRGLFLGLRQGVVIARDLSNSISLLSNTGSK
jgi:hypothetical protein